MEKCKDNCTERTIKSGMCLCDLKAKTKNIKTNIMYTDPTETIERDLENEINTLENRVFRLDNEKYFIKKALKEVVAILTDEQKAQVEKTLESIKYY